MKLSNYLKPYVETTVIVDNCYMKYYLYDTDKPLVFTFANANRTDPSCVISPGNIDRSISPWGYEFMKSLGVNIVSLASINYPSWYRSPELEKFMYFVGENTNEFAYKVSYGDSMGAFGASVFSNELKINMSLLLYPISTLNIELAPFVKKYEFARASYDWTRGLYDGAISKCNGVIIYDPLCKSDRLHQKRYGANYERIRCTGLGHGCAGILNKNKLLKPLILDILDNRLDINRHRFNFKSVIRTLPAFYVALDKAARKRRKRRYANSSILNIIRELLEDKKIEEAIEISLQNNKPNEHADVFRDFAIKSECYDLQLSYVAMSFAKEIRPDGPIIRKKLEKYSADMYKEEN